MNLKFKKRLCFFLTLTLVVILFVVGVPVLAEELEMPVQHTFTVDSGEEGSVTPETVENDYDEEFEEEYIAETEEVTPDIILLNTENSFAGGTGTEQDPYLVETAEHLYNVRYNQGLHFRQIADIDLTSHLNWNPIGDAASYFTGCYDWL